MEWNNFDEWIADAPLGTTSWAEIGPEASGLSAEFPKRIEQQCPDCGQKRVFSFAPFDNHVVFEHGGDAFVAYHCAMCRYKVRIAIRCEEADKDDWVGVFKKIAHWPAPITVDQRLRRLLGSERWPLYRNGLNNERFGCGIGAFAYYRRIIEEMMSEILEELLLDAPDDDTASTLRRAVSGEERVADRIQKIDDSTVVPRSMFLNGESPFKLLYKNLSDGIHNRSDEECLTRATALRTIFEYLANVLCDRRERREKAAEAAKSLR